MDDGYGWSDRVEMTGVFKEDSRGFNLSIDNPFKRDDYSDMRFTLEIIGVYTANIRQIDFINIDRWTEDLINDFIEAIEANY